MPASPNPQGLGPYSDSSPYTPTSDFDTASFASLFSTKSVAMDSALSFASSQDGARSSIMASLSSQMNNPGGSSQSTTLATSTAAASSNASSSTASAASAVGASSAAATSSSSQSMASATSSSITSSSTSTNAASSTSASASSAANNAADNLHKESSTMSSPGMQAAVAVPIVVVVLGIIAIIFFCMRRRKKSPSSLAAEETEKSPPMSRKKRWTRHLRMFSFDTELLMGGRYSSTNSIRSRQTGSLRSANRSQHSETPSLHSVDEVAPPYRDAISAAQPPTIASVMARAVPSTAAAPVATGLNRSASTATAGTAPPPYGAAGRIQTPTSPSSRLRPESEDPFADNENSPISPVAEGSPFRDPPNISRNSSMYRNDRDDASTLGGVSDAGSIRQATVARNASVMSGGRIINNVSDNSQ